MLPHCLVLSALLTPVALAAGPFSGGGSGEQTICSGSYEGSPVRDLCAENWPSSRERRVWLVLFYAPWCGHCQSLHLKYSELARQLAAEGEDGVVVGAIDCSEPEHRSLCRKHRIAGYPTIKALVPGKPPESYDGARETAPLKRWVLGVLQRRGGSAKCPAGLFGDDANEAAVVPLCSKHFPDEKARHDWLVIRYTAHNARGRDSSQLKRALQQLASDLGNGGGRGRQGKRELLKAMGESYGLRLKLPKAGPPGSGPLAKVGAVCCDCDDAGDICTGARALPRAAWVGRGGEGSVDLGVGGRSFSAHRLAELVCHAMGFCSLPSANDQHVAREEEL